MNESQWQRRITDLCDWLHLRWHHETDSTRSKPGFPDLVIVGPNGVLYLELKAEKGRIEPAQQAWHDDLKRAGAEVYIAKPSDWDFISDRLHVLAGRHLSVVKGDPRMTALCFIDTETTGLDARIHQPYEVSWWREEDAYPTTLRLPHMLEHADASALRIGGYWERKFAPGDQPLDVFEMRGFIEVLRGATLVGSNPAFDAAMLTRFIGAPVWHHRLIDVAAAGMWVFDWDRPKGLADVAAECRERGHDIPEPNHTAEGDVRTTRAVYYALRAERGRL